jgi:hypothetical protein
MIESTAPSSPCGIAWGLDQLEHRQTEREAEHDVGELRVGLAGTSRPASAALAAPKRANIARITPRPSAKRARKRSSRCA